MSFIFPTEAYLAKGYLESYGIETYLQDEMTVQVHNFYSNAIGGVKLLVKESDCDQGIHLLKQGGYLNEADNRVEYNNVIFSTDQIKSKHNCPFCSSENISRNKKVNVLTLAVYLIIGAVFPIFKSTYTCFDCGKEYKFRRKH